MGFLPACRDGFMPSLSDSTNTFGLWRSDDTTRSRSTGHVQQHRAVTAFPYRFLSMFDPVARCWVRARRCGVVLTVAGGIDSGVESGARVPTLPWQPLQGARPRRRRCSQDARPAGGTSPTRMAVGVRCRCLDVGALRRRNVPGARVLLFGIDTFGRETDRGRLVLSVDHPVGLGT